ncbi:MAG TPA: tetratricopeptide repeat protein [Caulobacteraceae bacterium]|jgi:tetratricopeptide (TPR) repeat protein
MQSHRPDAATLQTLCGQGLAAHQAGRLDEAWARYGQVLDLDARHYDALRLSGVLCLQIGRAAEAVDFIGRAIAVQPNAAVAHGNLASAFNALGRFEEAVASSDRAIALAPDYVEAYGARGRALYQQGRLEAALDSYRRMAALRPQASAFFNCGVMQRGLGRADEALASFDQAIALDPDYADAHHSRGVVLRELGRPEDAVAAFDRAIALRPAHPEAHYDRGLALRALGRFEAALQSYDQALALDPAHPEALSSRGNVLTDLKRYEEALESYAAALRVRPDHAEAWSNQMPALAALKRPEAALAACDRAIALRPDHVEGHINRGGALYEFQRLDEALASYDRALELAPDHATAHVNRGVLLMQLRRLDEAMDSFDRAVALNPRDAEAYFQQAMCRLALGDEAGGWAQYEWRWATRQFEAAQRDLAAPLWLGEEDTRGRTILLHGEQGLGDVLQFCRYAPVAAQRGARVVLEVFPVLLRLLGRLEGVAEVVPRGGPLPPHDFHAPLMSLPLALGARPEADGRPYLSADPDAVSRWAARLDGESGLRVGLCWAGGARPDEPIAHAIDKRRSLPLTALAPLAAIPGVRLYSLQKGPPAAELDAWSGPPIVDLTAELKDFADTAALIANLDLVIVCDTAVAHLAGGLGRPVWILNRFDTCWRWGTDGDASPWYPTARLFTQAAAGDWDGVMARVKGALEALAGRTRPA